MYCANIAWNDAIYCREYKIGMEKMTPKKNLEQRIAHANGATAEWREDPRYPWKRVPENQEPSWRDDCEWRISKGEVEGYPAFVGDVVYWDDGKKTVISDNWGNWTLWHRLSWNPTKPKTVTDGSSREDCYWKPVPLSEIEAQQKEIALLKERVRLYEDDYFTAYDEIPTDEQVREWARRNPE